MGKKACSIALIGLPFSGCIIISIFPACMPLSHLENSLSDGLEFSSCVRRPEKLRNSLRVDVGPAESETLKRNRQNRGLDSFGKAP